MGEAEAAITINAANSFNQALELFSSLYEDMFPSDLPAGLSPDNADVIFLPGQVGTRPAVNRVLTSPTDTGSKLSLTEYAQPTGDNLDIWLSSNGSLWQQDAASLAIVQIGTVAITPGSQFRSVTAFDKQFFAFFNPGETSIFTDSPFVGCDVPRYYDGKNVWRVTQDAPGFAPTFANVPTSPIPLVTTSPSGTELVTSAISSGMQRILNPNPGGESPIVTTVYTTITYMTASGPPASWLNTQVTITGLTGANASLVNVTGILVEIIAGGFILNVGTGSTFVDLTGQSGVATLSGNYFSRQASIVTAYTGGTPPSQFQAGFYAQIINSDGSQINGPNWTITSIVRDSTGLVTVTISTQLTNLSSGSVLYINASDTTDFPVGSQTVYQVLSASGGTTVFTISNPTWGNGAIASSSGGSVYQQWSGIFQILSVGVDANGNNYFTYFQLGPDISLTSTGGTPQAQLQAQIPPGPRNAVLIFESEDGAQTAPSVPIQISVDGGTNLLSYSNLLIGPPGTAKRIIAFTPAYGSSYFYVTPAYIPSTAGLSPVLSLGTIINDNTTIAGILDFSDAQLTAGTEIDVQGNNLFNQVVLAPCLGCIEYEGRMGWWGEINNVKNILNSGLDGGYTPASGIVNTSGDSVTLVGGSEFLSSFAGATIYINGSPYPIASITSGTALVLSGAGAGTQTGVPFYVLSVYGDPPNWTTSGAVTLTAQADQSLGFAVQMVSQGTEVYMTQPCYQDYYGAPIIAPNTPYVFRCLASRSGPSGSVLLSASIFSASTGFLAEAFINAIPSSQGWVTGTFPALATVPQDAYIKIGFIGAGGATANTLIIDELEFIDASQPVLFQQMRLSYFDNEFGYDDETGLLGLDGSAKITAAFKQRSYLYALTDGPLFQTQNNGQTEPDDWSFTDFADACDCFGPNAVDTTEDVAWWAGRSGFRLFLGSQPKKISQEIQPTWETIDQNAPTQVWVCDDPIERIVYIGVPIGSGSLPSLVLPMSYRSVDAVYNVPDPLHTSYSGKLIATDLCRKWTRWNLPMCCGAILTRPGLQRQMFFGGPQKTFSGNLYYLNSAKYTDDDFGQISSYYVTYFFFNHDTESMAPGLGLHQKINTYLTAYVTGVGQIQPLALVNNLNNPWMTTQTVWNPLTQAWGTSGSPQNPIPAYNLTNGVLLNDLEWGLNVNSGARMAIKWYPVPLAGQTDAAFQLTHMVLSSHEAIIPIRGAL